MSLSKPTVGHGLVISTAPYDALHPSSTQQPQGRGRAGSVLQVFSPLNVTERRSLDNSSATPYPDSRVRPNKARTESRKLLAHVLDELRLRNSVPSIFESTVHENVSATGKVLGAVMQSVRGVVSPQTTRTKEASLTARTFSLPPEDSDEEIDQKTLFSTDATFDLLTQLKEILTISHAQGWHILDDDIPSDMVTRVPDDPNNRFRRTSFQSYRSRSRSPSPMGTTVQPSELLPRCIDILGSIVLEDCRFQVASLRLRKPPNALQALVLDVSQVLIHTHRNDPKVVRDIALALVPAFYTYPSQMHAKLLGFFEDVIMRSALMELDRIHFKRDFPNNQSNFDKKSKVEEDLSFSEPPMVSIQVDEPDEEFYDNPSVPDESARRKLVSKINALFSTSSPSQSPAVQYLSSLVTPVITAVLDTVQLTPQENQFLVTFRAFRLLELIVGMKPDAHMDILNIVAYHSGQARQAALGLLFTIWPKSMGHIVVGKVFPMLTYENTLNPTGDKFAKPIDRFGKTHTSQHQFVPWRFTNVSATLDGIALNNCRSCSNDIVGFGLFCSFCMCAVHFDCCDSPDYCTTAYYAVQGDSNTQKVASFRFSPVLTSRRDTQTNVMRSGQHAFRLVNIFTLTLCFVCHEPLWGTAMQALQCAICGQFAHSHCAMGEFENSARSLACRNDTRPISDITVDWNDLRQSFASYYRNVMYKHEDLHLRSHEELSIFWCHLWTQLQLLQSGVASGTIIIQQESPKLASKQKSVEDYELHYLVKLYEAYLRSDECAACPAIDAFIQTNPNGQKSDSYMLLFDWPTLAFMTSMIKSSSDVKTGPKDSPNLLNVYQEVNGNEVDDGIAFQPFERVSIPRLKEVLATTLHVVNEQAFRILLTYLHHLGFVDCPSISTDDQSGDTMCSFSIPLGIDVSVDVETLVVAVEVCLGDIDIAVNETGFLFLLRKFWPSGLASDYALSRLLRSVLSWIFAEDLNLASILRDFIARGRNLPGVPSGSDKPSWPQNTKTRSGTTATSGNNGGEYVALRKTLLTRYASPWLMAIHDLSPVMYTDFLLQATINLSTDARPLSIHASTDDFTEPTLAEGFTDVQADELVRHVTKLCQSGVAFTVVDDLLIRCFDLISQPPAEVRAVSSLSRLFSQESEAFHRMTIFTDASFKGADSQATFTFDPWRTIVAVASQSFVDLRRCLRWLRVFAVSSVDIPLTIYQRMLFFARQHVAAFEQYAELSEAIFFSTWMKSLGKQDGQSLVIDILSLGEEHTIQTLRTGDTLTNITRFLRLTLCTCLLLYGSDRTYLSKIGLVTDDDVKMLASRRKITRRASAVNDPVIVSPVLMSCLQRYMDACPEGVGGLVAQFLSAVLLESTLMEQHEVDNFILRNCNILTNLIWSFYNIDLSSVKHLRGALLLRILVVDSQPFENLLESLLHTTANPDIRLRTASQLFKVILDISNPSFDIEGRQWRSNTMSIFDRFFSCIWLDSNEEIRFSTEVWSQTLQPSHRRAISSCWNEAFSKAPVADKRKLVTFLLHLRPHFPSWEVLSWEVIIETLLDDDFMQRLGNNDEEPLSAHLSMYGISSRSDDGQKQTLDPDMSILQSSLVMLSLQMIADGVEIDLSSLLKVKYHLARLLGFEQATQKPAPSGQTFYVALGSLQNPSDAAFQCFDAIMALIDAPHHAQIPTNAMINADEDSPARLLVGSAFVDVVLELFNQIEDLTTLPFLALKSLLRCLTIVLYKHNLDARPLSHLRDAHRKAVRRAAELMLSDVSYEIRQSALIICETYIKRWPHFVSPILIYLLQSMISLVSSLKLNSEDVLVAQASAFLESTLTHYSSQGAFYLLCKKANDNDFFLVIRHVVNANARTNPSAGRTTLRETILRDTFKQVQRQQDDPAKRLVIGNMESYIDVVFHQNYSADLMQTIGQILSDIMRTAGDMSGNTFDANSVINIASTLIQHNKAQCRDFLVYTETLLRIALARFEVSVPSLTRLLQVSMSLYRRTTIKIVTEDKTPVISSLVLVVSELLSETLRGKSRVTSCSLTSMIQAICSIHEDAAQSVQEYTRDIMRRLAIDALYFMQNSDGQYQQDFVASNAIVSLIRKNLEIDPSFLLHTSAESQVEGRSYEVSFRSFSVRTWNLLVLNALQSGSLRSCSLLFTQQQDFVAALYISLNEHAQKISLSNLLHVDVNHAYFAVKLWLLLARRCSVKGSTPTSNGNPQSEADAAEDVEIRSLWNTLWAPFENLLALSETEAERGDLSPVASLVWSSIVDIILFIRQLRSIIALDTSWHITTLNRVKALKSIAPGESISGKLARAVNSMSEPPVDVPIDVLINRTAHDIEAAEKLHALDMREGGRMPSDRSRRD